jgi:hypothetical protein
MHDAGAAALLQRRGLVLGDERLDHGAEGAGAKQDRIQLL